MVALQLHVGEGVESMELSADKFRALYSELQRARDLMADMGG